jgi:hypothetical protein
VSLAARHRWCSARSEDLTKDLWRWVGTSQVGLVFTAPDQYTAGFLVPNPVIWVLILIKARPVALALCCRAWTNIPGGCTLTLSPEISLERAVTERPRLNGLTLGQDSGWLIRHGNVSVSLRFCRRNSVFHEPLAFNSTIKRRLNGGNPVIEVFWRHSKLWDSAFEGCLHRGRGR